MSAGETSGTSPGIVSMVEPRAAKAAGRRHDRAGVTISRAVAPDPRAQAQGDVGGSGVDRDDDDAGQFRHGRNGLQDVLEHREGQLLPHVSRTAIPARRCFAAAVSLTGTTAQMPQSAFIWL